MKSIIALVALTIMASPSFAATKTTKKVAKTTTTTTTTKNTAPAVTYENSSHHSKGNINWTAGFGLGTAGSAFHFGVLGGGMVSVANTEMGEIFVGGKSGFLYGPTSPATWMIPILVDAQLNLKKTGNTQFYTGLAMGVTIFHVEVPAIVSTILSSIGQSATSTSFAILVKGGLTFGDEGKYFAELPLGTMGSAFAIFPTVGMKF